MAARSERSRDRAVTLESLRQDQAARRGARLRPGHTPRNVLLAMVGEVGELSELFQWRGDAGCGVDLPAWSDADKRTLGRTWRTCCCTARLGRCGVGLPAVAKAKLAKNEAKYPAEKCFGSAAKYTRLRLRRASRRGADDFRPANRDATTREERDGESTRSRTRSLSCNRTSS